MYFEKCVVGAVRTAGRVASLDVAMARLALDLSRCTLFFSRWRRQPWCE